MKKKVRISLASSEELKNPDIAYPTVILAIISMATYMSIFFLFWNNPTCLTIPISTLSVYLAFTPFHDAVHWAISTKYRWINESIGHLCGIPMNAPFIAFRFCHLMHHKHTNDPLKDPDMWSNNPNLSFLQQVFAWATQSTHYAYYYIKHGKSWWDIFIHLGELIVFYIVMAIFTWYGYWKQVMYFVIIPRIMGEIILAYTFDYVPHRPSKVKREEDIYRCTNRINGLFHTDDSVNLSWILLYQNYHNIHHLYPMIPFYSYKKLWDNHKEELVHLRTPFTSLFGKMDNEKATK